MYEGGSCEYCVMATIASSMATNPRALPMYDAIIVGLPPEISPAIIALKAAAPRTREQSKQAQSMLKLGYGSQTG